MSPDSDPLPGVQNGAGFARLHAGKGRPMDRLVCGDVGYGKTEVAIRAAVKAASDGKQVMILAPTTILAQQHLGTFRERLADLPFRVDGVSRLRRPGPRA